MPLPTSHSVHTLSSLYHPAHAAAVGVMTQGNSHMEIVHALDTNAHTQMLSQIARDYLTPLQRKFQTNLQALVRDKHGVFDPLMIAASWQAAKPPKGTNLRVVDILLIALDIRELHQYLANIIDTYVTQTKLPLCKKEKLIGLVQDFIQYITEECQTHELATSVTQVNFFIMEHVADAIIQSIDAQAQEKIHSIGFPDILQDEIAPYLLQLMRLKKNGSAIAFSWISDLFSEALNTQRTNLPALRDAFEAQYRDDKAIDLFGALARYHRLTFLASYLIMVVNRLNQSPATFPFNAAQEHTYQFHAIKYAIDEEYAAVTNPSFKYSAMRSENYLQQTHDMYMRTFHPHILSFYHLAHPINIQPPSHTMHLGG